MSRLSDYTDADLLNIITLAGYQRLSGTHKNASSPHELQHSCGMVNTKTSKTLLSNKRGCTFIPCHRRGKLSLLYLKAVAKQQGLDDVTHEHEGKKPLNQLVISADDILTWRKGDLTMTQSWKTVRSRALSVKKGVFFQPDDTRRQAPSGPLTQALLDEICASKNLVAPANAPARRSDKVSYTHILCGKALKLRFNELGDWHEAQCGHCHPVEKTAFEAFNRFLIDRQMTFEGSLRLKSDKRQVMREQIISIICNVCGERNKPKSYDQIRYRGFTYCDNSGCQNTYPPEDRTGESDQYYIDLMQKHGLKSFASAQKLFPKAMRYLKHTSDETPIGVTKPILKYQVVHRALKLPANARSNDFTDAELRCAFQAAIADGATTLGHIRAKLPNNINNFITRRIAMGDFVHHRVLDTLDMRYKRSYAISSLAEAIDCVSDTKCATWGEFVSRYPGAGASIIDQGFKEDVMAEFGWIPLVNYSRLTNAELLEKAGQLCHDEGLNSLVLLETSYGSLVRNIREKNLIAELCDQQGYERPTVWQGMSFDDLVQHIRDSDFASSSDWHASSSGSYKYASSQNWVREIAKEFSWGYYQGLNGFGYDSLPETIVANILYLADYDFVDHPPIDRFVGYGGGRPMSDFLIGSISLWIEVWAYRCEEVVIDGKLKDYPAKRQHKEHGYRTNDMRLCSLEGGLFYRPYTLDGIKYRGGMSSFVSHVCRHLTQHGIPVAYDAELLSKLRKSVNGQSNALSIKR